MFLSALFSFESRASVSNSRTTGRQSSRAKADTQIFPKPSARKIASAEVAKQMTCDLKRLSAAHIEVLEKKDSGQWGAVSQESYDLLLHLNFKPVKENRSFANLKNHTACEDRRDYFKTFMTKSFDLAFVVQNSCQEQRAQQLGLVPHAPQNYGSMEVENEVKWQVLNICTDGTLLFSCPNQTAAMQNCLSKLDSSLTRF